MEEKLGVVPLEQLGQSLTYPDRPRRTPEPTHRSCTCSSYPSRRPSSSATSSDESAPGWSLPPKEASTTSPSPTVPPRSKSRNPSPLTLYNHRQDLPPIHRSSLSCHTKPRRPRHLGCTAPARRKNSPPPPRPHRQPSRISHNLPVRYALPMAMIFPRLSSTLS